MATLEHSGMSDVPFKPIVNIDELEFMTFGKGDKFAAEIGGISPRIGAKQIGCNLTVVEPGKRGFPFHVHHVNEEMFFILEGSGEYRFGDQTYPIRKGDVLAAPAGGPEYAHQIINTGTQTLKYLALSTKSQPEVVEYPDSGKFLVVSRMDEGDPRTAKLRYIGRPETCLDYFDGEDV